MAIRAIILRHWRSFALLALALGGTTQAAETHAVALSGHVRGATHKHAVFVALWRADGFLQKPAETVKIAAGVEPVFRFSVAPGRWAISAYEDVNGNEILDMGMFGPKEPSGFWQPFHKWRKPQFDDVATDIKAAVAGIEIAL